MLPKKQVIPAVNFFNGKANVNEHSFGKGLIVDSGEKSAFLRWKFSITKNADYSLYSVYAANDKRPVKLFIDGKIIKDDAMIHTTGGWTNQNTCKVFEKSIYLKKGNHILSLKTDNYIPHIDSFIFEAQSIFKKKIKIINPYKNRSPSLINKFLSHLNEKGFKKAVIKSLLYMTPQQLFLNKYADILGVFTKKQAFKGPWLAQIDITNNCNNDCLGCWCNSPLLQDKKMPEEQKKMFIRKDKCFSILQELSEAGCREVYFSGGGEPFMHPDAMDIFIRAKELNFVVYINTNFTLLTKKDLNKLIKYKIDHLTVSVWAGDAGFYQITHPNKRAEDFAKLKENLFYLNSNKEAKPYTKVYHVLMNKNISNFRGMYDFAVDTNSDSVEFTLIDTMPGRTDSLLPNEGQINELYTKALQLQQTSCSSPVLFAYDTFLRRLKANNSGKALWDDNIIKKVPCTIGWTFIRINADGDVNSCLKSHRYPVGNINKSSFKDIWNGKRQQNFRTHTYAMKDNDPFFKNIGNDPSLEQGCLKSCDDIGRNIKMQEKISSLSFIEKKLLKLTAFFLKNKSQAKEVKKLNLPESNAYRSGTAITGPKTIAVDLTDKCPLNCLPCFTRSPLLPPVKNNSDTLKLEIIKKTIDDLAELNCERIRFTGGGDPLVHTDLAEIINYASDRKIYTELTTSFFKLPAALLKSIQKKKLHEINISLLAGDEKTYQKMHPGADKNLFKIIINNIKTLKEYSFLKVALSLVLTNKNTANIENFLNLGKELGVDNLYLAKLNPVHKNLNSLTINNDEEKQLLKTISSFRKKNPAIQINYKDILKTNSVCSVAWHFSRITAKGDVIPCCNAVNNKMGNINQVSFKEIWFSEKYNKFRSLLKKENINPLGERLCSHCDNQSHNDQFYSSYLTDL